MQLLRLLEGLGIPVLSLTIIMDSKMTRSVAAASRFACAANRQLKIGAFSIDLVSNTVFDSVRACAVSTINTARL